jgi:hypothetical protein
MAISYSIRNQVAAGSHEPPDLAIATADGRHHQRNINVAIVIAKDKPRETLPTPLACQKAT